jgi:hypothetical protein
MTLCLATFSGSHGALAEPQDMPAMRWRFEDGVTGEVSFEDNLFASEYKHLNQGPGGINAKAGDTWYKPIGIWMNLNGQANPYQSPVWNNNPALRQDGSTWLKSFWPTDVFLTDHRYIKYNNLFYDPSYRGGGAGFPTHNELADSGVSHYYYDKKYVFVGKIESVTVLDGGSGYTSLPDIAIVGSGGSGTGATATPIIVGGKVDQINIVTNGAGYLPPVSVTISGGGATTNADAKPVVVLWEDKSIDLPLQGIWLGRTYYPSLGALVPEAWQPSQHLLIAPQNPHFNEMNEE